MSPLIATFAVLVALAVGLAAIAFAITYRAPGAKAVSDRLRRLVRPAQSADRIDVERDERYSAVPWIDRTLRALSIGQNLELLLYQAGVRMRVGALMALVGAMAMGGYLLGVFLFHRLFPGLVFLVLGGVAPYVYVLVQKQKRMKAFADQFPDALDLLVSGLRAGLSFTAAMQIVSEESPEPMRSEFAVTVEEQALGLDLREAMDNFTRRVNVTDLRFFVTAVMLQRETGGNLAEVLSKSAALIRDRYRVLGDIRTFTAQGKLTAGVLVALPIGIGLFTYIATPDYFTPMLNGSAGQTALWFAGGLQLAGLLVILKIVNIKV